MCVCTILKVLVTVASTEALTPSPSHQIVTSNLEILFSSHQERGQHYGRLAYLIDLKLNSTFLILAQRIETNFLTIILTGLGSTGYGKYIQGCTLMLIWYTRFLGLRSHHLYVSETINRGGIRGRSSGSGYGSESKQIFGIF